MIDVVINKQKSLASKERIAAMLFSKKAFDFLTIRLFLFKRPKSKF